MLRCVLLALLLLLGLPAAAGAGWSPAERLPFDARPPGPRPAVEVVERRPPGGRPVTVRFSDGTEQDLPG